MTPAVPFKQPLTLGYWAREAVPCSFDSEPDVTKDWSRQPQRRGFDDNNDLPFPDTQSAPHEHRFQPVSGPPTAGTVKWYSPDKGFGFVQLSDGSGDAFLHASTLERSGNGILLPGSTLEMRVAPGQKGPQVTEVISVDSSTALQEPPRRSRPERPTDRSTAQTEDTGTVKFYAAAKGFGFITRDGDGRDVFVHASVLRRAGIAELAQGQRVALTIGEAPKGPEAVSLRLL